MKQKNKKIFVTGSTGKIGTYLTKALKRNSWEVICLRNDINETEKYEKQIKGCQVIYHLAVYQNILDDQYEKFYKVNVLGTKNLLDLAVKYKIKKFIYVSTAMVFKNTGKIERNENWPKKRTSNNFYVKSKLRALEIVNKYKKKIPIIVLYPSIVLDPKRKGFNGKLMRWVGQRNRVENFVMIQDLIKMMVKVIDKGKIGEDYILGGKNIILKNLFNMTIPIWFIKIFSFIKIVKAVSKNPPGDLCLNTEKINNILK